VPLRFHLPWQSYRWLRIPVSFQFSRFLWFSNSHYASCPLRGPLYFHTFYPNYSGCHLHPITFRFILWLMPSAMIFLLVIFASTAFRMALYSHVYMASHMAFVRFPLAGVRVQVSITLSECRSIFLHIDFFSFHFVHPGFVFGLPHGLVSSNSHIHIGIVPKGFSFNDFRSKC
jgi:hypothetical protein